MTQPFNHLPPMHFLQSTVIIDIPVAAAWEKMRDLTASVHYVPGLLACDITTEQKEGVGASRRVQTKAIAMDETVTEWHENQGFRIRLHDGDNGPPVFAEAYFTSMIEEAGADRTRFTARMDYRMPWGVLGKLLAVAVINPASRGKHRDIAVGMKYYYEHCRKAPPDELKRLKKRLPRDI